MRLRYCYDEGFMEIFEMSPGTFTEYMKIKNSPNGFANRASYNKTVKAQNKYRFAKIYGDNQLLKTIIETR